MKKSKVVKVPEIYAGLDLTRGGLDKTLVIDKNGQSFVFDNGSVVSIIKDAIIHQWTGWESFDTDIAATRVEMHVRAFGCEMPKKCDATESSVYVWKKLLSMAADRTNAGNPINQVKDGAVVNSRSKLATRKYHLGADSDKPAVVSAIHTPQAKVCYAILCDGVSAHPEGITETDLKALVNTRAAEIKTRQDPWRIFQYYRPTLIAAKLVRHD